jgi:hypothetical protein
MVPQVAANVNLLLNILSYFAQPFAFLALDDALLELGDDARVVDDRPEAGHRLAGVLQRRGDEARVEDAPDHRCRIQGRPASRA